MPTISCVTGSSAPSITSPSKVTTANCSGARLAMWPPDVSSKCSVPGSLALILPCPLCDMTPAWKSIRAACTSCSLNSLWIKSAILVCSSLKRLMLRLLYTTVTFARLFLRAKRGLQAGVLILVYPRGMNIAMPGGSQANLPWQIQKIQMTQKIQMIQGGRGMQPLSLVHLVRQPIVEVRNPPLLLLLHGVGSNEYDLFGLAPYLDERFLIISVRAPNTIQPRSYAWFDVDFTPQGPVIDPAQAEASREAVVAFLGEAVTAYSADSKQVYLVGFSQGAIMSASVALTRPDLVAGVVLMSGRILPEIQPLIAASEALEGLPFLVVHGTADTVLPITIGPASNQCLSSLPVELTYNEYTMGHEVSQESLDDVASWLSAHLDRAKHAPGRG